MTTNIAARGVLKRHCAIGKTPLLTARLCNRPLACQSAALQEYPLARPRPSFALFASRAPPAPLPTRWATLSYALNAGAAMLALAAIATAFQGRLARGFSFFAPHTARIREIGIRSGCRFTA